MASARPQRSSEVGAARRPVSTTSSERPRRYASCRTLQQTPASKLPVYFRPISTGCHAQAMLPLAQMACITDSAAKRTSVCFASSMLTGSGFDPGLSNDHESRKDSTTCSRAYFSGHFSVAGCCLRLRRCRRAIISKTYESGINNDCELSSWSWLSGACSPRSIVAY